MAGGGTCRACLQYDNTPPHPCLALTPAAAQERYKLIDSEVIQPRKKEQHKIQTGQWQYAYQYDKVGTRSRGSSGPQTRVAGRARRCG